MKLRRIVAAIVTTLALINLVACHGDGSSSNQSNEQTPSTNTDATKIVGSWALQDSVTSFFGGLISGGVGASSQDGPNVILTFNSDGATGTLLYPHPQLEYALPLTQTSSSSTQGGGVQLAPGACFGQFATVPFDYTIDIAAGTLTLTATAEAATVTTVGTGTVIAASVTFDISFTSGGALELSSTDGSEIHVFVPYTGTAGPNESFASQLTQGNWVLENSVAGASQGGELGDMPFVLAFDTAGHGTANSWAGEPLTQFFPDIRIASSIPDPFTYTIVSSPQTISFSRYCPPDTICPDFELPPVVFTYQFNSNEGCNSLGLTDSAGNIFTYQQTGAQEFPYQQTDGESGSSLR